MASLADVAMDSDASMADQDDASMTEDEDLTAAVEELADVLGVSSDKVPALKSALEAIILAVR